MNPNVQFIGIDGNGIIYNERWQATRAHCPKCGNGDGCVWMLVSEPPIQVKDLELRIFLCISCQFTAVGLNGFRPAFNPADRSAQIIKYGFPETE